MSVHFTVFDFSVLTIILLSGIHALIRGFVRELFSLIAWGSSFLIAAHFYPLLQPSIAQYIKTPAAVVTISAIGVFCLSLIALLPLAILLSGLVRGAALSAIDRSMGFVFGILRGALITSLVYLIITWMWPHNQPMMIKKSQVSPFLAYGADVSTDLLALVVPKNQMDMLKDLKSPKPEPTAKPEPAAASSTPPSTASGTPAQPLPPVHPPAPAGAITVPVTILLPGVKK